MTNTNSQLRSIVSRIIRLSEERKGLLADINDVLKEAASSGYDPRAIRAVVKRQMESDEARQKRETVESEVDLILSALGEYASSPLGQAALERAA